MRDTKDYLDCPTITSLSLQDKNEYRLSHISIVDLMKRIEVLEETSEEQLHLIKEQKVKLDSYMNSITVLAHMNEQNITRIQQNEKHINELEKKLESFKSILESKIKIDNTFDFGTYENKPIKWIVLDQRQDGSKLLLSKDILFTDLYNKKFISVTWETCTLRKYLNNDFYKNAFSLKEQEKIVKNVVLNNDNSKYRTKGGNKTEDFIFLLSIEEIKKYFSSNDERIANMNGKENYYWLRSIGANNNYAVEVSDDGHVYEGGRNVDCENVGVRPALWVKF